MMLSHCDRFIAAAKPIAGEARRKKIHGSARLHEGEVLQRDRAFLMDAGILQLEADTGFGLISGRLS